ncbi:conserved hypothetical protein [Moraxellaceae bacterium 17A]|nr:conserved hypothetical protein [Moraxellaceae bacterium 17A]
MSFARLANKIGKQDWQTRLANKIGKQDWQTRLAKGRRNKRFKRLTPKIFIPLKNY